MLADSKPSKLISTTQGCTCQTPIAPPRQSSRPPTPRRSSFPPPAPSITSLELGNSRRPRRLSEQTTQSGRENETVHSLAGCLNVKSRFFRCKDIAFTTRRGATRRRPPKGQLVLYRCGRGRSRSSHRRRLGPRGGRDFDRTVVARSDRPVHRRRRRVGRPANWLRPPPTGQIHGW